MFPLSKWHAAWIGAAVFLSLFAGASIRSRHNARPQGPVRITEAPAPAAATVSPNRRGPLFVHVTGRVARPGLYRFPAGARVMDAVTGAGGATAEANLDALNLATPLQDGQKLVVPALGDPPPRTGQGYLQNSPAPPAAVLVRADPIPRPVEAATSARFAAPVGSASTPSVAGGKLKNPGDGVVNINTAGSLELQRLPGVGPSTARKILDYRAAHGGYRTVEELMEITGIGEAKLARMRPFVAL